MSRFSDLFQEPVPAPKSISKVDEYNENATDRDGDGLVQEGTPFERPISAKTVRKKYK
jgi:hypothetical protein